MKIRDDLPPPRGLLWFSMLGAPAAWAVQGLTGWLLLSSICAGPETLSPDRVRGGLLTLSFASMAVALLGIVAGLYLYRLHMHELPHRLTGHARPAFMAGMGLLVSTVFLLALVFATLPLFSLPLCEVGR